MCDQVGHRLGVARTSLGNHGSLTDRRIRLDALLACSVSFGRQRATVEAARHWPVDGFLSLLAPLAVPSQTGNICAFVVSCSTFTFGRRLTWFLVNTGETHAKMTMATMDK